MRKSVGLVSLLFALCSLVSGLAPGTASTELERFPILGFYSGNLGPFRHGTYPSLGNNTHVGVDILAPEGIPVSTFGEGTVIDGIYSETDKDFQTLGYMALIEHSFEDSPRKLYTLYLTLWHLPLSKLGTKSGDGGRLGSLGTQEKRMASIMYISRFAIFAAGFFPAGEISTGRVTNVTLQNFQQTGKIP